MATDKTVSKSVLMYELDENVNHFQNSKHIQGKAKYSINSNDNRNILNSPHLADILSQGINFDLASHVSEICRRKQIQFDFPFVTSCQSAYSYDMPVSSKDCDNPHSKIQAVKTVMSSETHQVDEVHASHVDPKSYYQEIDLLRESLQSQIDSSEFKNAISSNPVHNHSEAGPDVAQYTEDELRSASNYLNSMQSHVALKGDNIRPGIKYPDEQNFLCMYGSAEKKTIKQESTDMASDVTNDVSSTNMLINFSPSPKKAERTSSSRQFQAVKVSQDNKVFTEDELADAMKMLELQYRDRQLKREKEHTDLVEVLDKQNQMLRERISTIQKSTKAALGATEELLDVLHGWLGEKEKERVNMTSETQKITKDRDQALEDLKSVESAFADLHRRYESCKSTLEGYKQNEDRLKQILAEIQNDVKQKEKMYEMLRSRTQDKLNSANSEIESVRRSGDAELAVLRAQLKKAEIKISGLEKDIKQKEKENDELSNICDDLIEKVGKS